MSTPSPQPSQVAAPYAALASVLQQPTPLSTRTGATEAWHCWSQAELRAVWQAWASERPLLIRGEAGCGKSQLARALAEALQVPLVTEVIHPRYEATDLLYRDDPVRRLAQAQVLGATGTASQAAVRRRLDPHRFVRPGPLWKAFEERPPHGHAHASHPQWPRAVVLIDEIDKADADLPNALLGVLGDRSFTVHPTGAQVRVPALHRPLVLITTNEDRELPPAFVRRCAVLNMKPEDSSESAFVRWLMDRAQVHSALQALWAAPSDDEPAGTVPRAAAVQVWADRQAATNEGLPTVGLAEYLDLLYAVLRLSAEGASDGAPRAAPEPAAQAKRALGLLQALSAFALVKHRGQDQGRPAKPV